jgi:hypothetical protein
MKRQGIPVLAAFIAVLMITACKKDDPPIPVYVGTWSFSWGYVDGADTIDIKDIITLEADTYEEIIQMRNRTYMGSLTSYLGMKGALSVDGYTMTVSLNKVGISSADDNGMPTGNIMWFSKGEQDYYQLIYELGLAETFNSNFSIAGDVMTLLIDSNHDGDFFDPGEATIYARQ